MWFQIYFQSPFVHLCNLPSWCEKADQMESTWNLDLRPEITAGPPLSDLFWWGSGEKERWLLRVMLRFECRERCYVALKTLPSKGI